MLHRVLSVDVSNEMEAVNRDIETLLSRYERLFTEKVMARGDGKSRCKKKKRSKKVEKESEASVYREGYTPTHPRKEPYMEKPPLLQLKNIPVFDYNPPPAKDEVSQTSPKYLLHPETTDISVDDFQHGPILSNDEYCIGNCDSELQVGPKRISVAVQTEVYGDEYAQLEEGPVSSKSVFFSEETVLSDVPNEDQNWNTLLTEKRKQREICEDLQKFYSSTENLYINSKYASTQSEDCLQEYPEVAQEEGDEDEKPYEEYYGTVENGNENNLEDGNECDDVENETHNYDVCEQWVEQVEYTEWSARVETVISAQDVENEFNQLEEHCPFKTECSQTSINMIDDSCAELGTFVTRSVGPKESIHFRDVFSQTSLNAHNQSVDEINGCCCGDNPDRISVTHKFIEESLKKACGRTKACYDFDSIEDLLSKDVNEIDSRICIEMISNLADALLKQDFQQTPSDNDLNELSTSDNESIYAKQLKQLRTEHLKHIRREVKHIEDLDRLIRVIKHK